MTAYARSRRKSERLVVSSGREGRRSCRRRRISTGSVERDMDKADYLEAITADSETLLATAASLAPETTIAACGGWLVRDLVAHIGFVWGFAAANVTAAGEKTPPADPKPPEDESKLFEWAASVRTTMLEALTAADPGTAGYNGTEFTGMSQSVQCEQLQISGKGT